MATARQSPHLSSKPIPHLRHRIRHAPHGNHGKTGNRLLRLVGLRDQRVGEAELGGFPQPLLSALYWPHFAGEADFAEDHQPRRQRA